MRRMCSAAPSSPLLTNRPFSSPTLHLYSIQRLWSAARRPQIQTALSHAYGQDAGSRSDAVRDIALGISTLHPLATAAASAAQRGGMVRLVV